MMQDDLPENGSSQHDPVSNVAEEDIGLPLIEMESEPRKIMVVEARILLSVVPLQERKIAIAEDGDLDEVERYHDTDELPVQQKRREVEENDNEQMQPKNESVFVAPFPFHLLILIHRPLM
jgi:hypothetical protein